MRIEKSDLSSGPSSVTLAEIKAHLRLTHDDHDTYLTALLKAAEDHLSDITGVLLRYHRLRIFFEPELVVTVPYMPCHSVERVVYYPKDGTPFVTMTRDTDYIVLKYGGETRISFDRLPDVEGEGMRVDVLAGFNQSVSDPNVEMGIKLLVAHLYHNMLPAEDARKWKLPWGLAAFLGTLRHGRILERADGIS